MNKLDLITVITWPVEYGKYAGRMDASQFHGMRVGEEFTLCGMRPGWDLFLKDVTKMVWREARWRLTYAAFPGTMRLADFKDLTGWEKDWQHKRCQRCARVE